MISVSRFWYASSCMSANICSIRWKASNPFLPERKKRITKRQKPLKRVWVMNDYRSGRYQTIKRFPWRRHEDLRLPTCTDPWSAPRSPSPETQQSQSRTGKKRTVCLILLWFCSPEGISEPDKNPSGSEHQNFSGSLCRKPQTGKKTRKTHKKGFMGSLTESH